MSKYFIPKERNNNLIATKSFYKECSLFPALESQSQNHFSVYPESWNLGVENKQFSLIHKTKQVFFFFFSISQCD